MKVLKPNPIDILRVWAEVKDDPEYVTWLDLLDATDISPENQAQLEELLSDDHYNLDQFVEAVSALLVDSSQVIALPSMVVPHETPTTASNPTPSGSKLSEVIAPSPIAEVPPVVVTEKLLPLLSFPDGLIPGTVSGSPPDRRGQGEVPDDQAEIPGLENPNRQPSELGDPDDMTINSEALEVGSVKWAKVVELPKKVAKGKGLLLLAIRNRLMKDPAGGTDLDCIIAMRYAYLHPEKKQLYPKDRHATLSPIFERISRQHGIPNPLATVTTADDQVPRPAEPTAVPLGLAALAGTLVEQVPNTGQTVEPPPSFSVDDSKKPIYELSPILPTEQDPSGDPPPHINDQPVVQSEVLVSEIDLEPTVQQEESVSGPAQGVKSKAEESLAPAVDQEAQETTEIVKTQSITMNSEIIVSAEGKFDNAKAAYEEVYEQAFAEAREQQRARGVMGWLWPQTKKSMATNDTLKQAERAMQTAELEMMAERANREITVSDALQVSMTTASMKRGLYFNQNAGRVFSDEWLMHDVIQGVRYSTVDVVNQVNKDLLTYIADMPWARLASGNEKVNKIARKAGDWTSRLMGMGKRAIDQTVSSQAFHVGVRALTPAIMATKVLVFGKALAPLLITALVAVATAKGLESIGAGFDAKRENRQMESITQAIGATSEKLATVMEYITRENEGSLRGKRARRWAITVATAAAAVWAAQMPPDTLPKFEMPKFEMPDFGSSAEKVVDTAKDKAAEVSKDAVATGVGSGGSLPETQTTLDTTVAATRLHDMGSLLPQHDAGPIPSIMENRPDVGADTTVEISGPEASPSGVPEKGLWSQFKDFWGMDDDKPVVVEPAQQPVYTAPAPVAPAPTLDSLTQPPSGLFAPPGTLTPHFATVSAQVSGFSQAYDQLLQQTKVSDLPKSLYEWVTQYNFDHPNDQIITTNEHYVFSPQNHADFTAQIGAYNIIDHTSVDMHSDDQIGYNAKGELVHIPVNAQPVVIRSADGTFNQLWAGDLATGIYN